METPNPYQPPAGKIEDIALNQDDYGEIKILSASGRLGRLRYIAYSIGLTLLIYLLMGLLIAVAAQLPEPVNGFATIALVVLGYGALLIISVLLTIQRCHDFNSTGWLSLLLLIPLVPLIFWFIPGTDGRNNYGPPPPPNSKSMGIIVVVLFLVFIVLGILAAIAVPAYQDYVERAKQAQIQSE